MEKQRSEKWYELRRGLFTASQIHKLMGVRGIGKTGESYIYEKVTEFFGVYEDEIDAPAIRWGNYYESFAKEYYSIAFDEEIIESGFKISECGTHGASPDGLIKGKKKGIEIKCPFKASNHTINMTIKSQDGLKSIHPEYYWQIQHNLLIHDFISWDFVSFDPRFTGNKRMFAIEIFRNESDIKLLIERQANEIKNNIVKLIEL